MNEDFISEDMKLAVKSGAAWLDENHAGWEYKLDLSKLQMDRCSKCVIGQAVGEFYDTTSQAAGVRRHDPLAVEWSDSHGFSTDDFDGYPKLETLWTEEVQRRL